MNQKDYTSFPTNTFCVSRNNYLVVYNDFRTLYVQYLPGGRLELLRLDLGTGSPGSRAAKVTAVLLISFFIKAIFYGHL